MWIRKPAFAEIAKATREHVHRWTTWKRLAWLGEECNQGNVERIVLIEARLKDGFCQSCWLLLRGLRLKLNTLKRIVYQSWSVPLEMNKTWIIRMNMQGNKSREPHEPLCACWTCEMWGLTVQSLLCPCPCSLFFPWGGHAVAMARIFSMLQYASIHHKQA